MAHGRKPQPTSQFNSFAVWTTGAPAVLATLVLIARHVHI